VYALCAERPLVDEKDNTKNPPEPKPAPRMATAAEVQAFLARAKRVLFLYMPVSKTIH